MTQKYCCTLQRNAKTLYCILMFLMSSFQVWYQSYSNTRDEIFQFVTDLLSKTMNVEFDPGFIIKATWHKMRPHFIAEDDQVGSSSTD